MARVSKAKRSNGCSHSLRTARDHAARMMLHCTYMHTRTICFQLYTCVARRSVATLQTKTTYAGYGVIHHAYRISAYDYAKVNIAIDTPSRLNEVIPYNVWGSYGMQAGRQAGAQTSMLIWDPGRVSGNTSAALSMQRSKNLEGCVPRRACAHRAVLSADKDRKRAAGCRAAYADTASSRVAS